jgi:hypothetical protein
MRIVEPQLLPRRNLRCECDSLEKKRRRIPRRKKVGSRRQGDGHER